MPGIIVLRRRWSIGSDDLIIPALMLVIIHSAWLIVLSMVLSHGRGSEWKIQCMAQLLEYIVGYIVILGGCLVMELCIAWISFRGSIMNTKPRSSMQYILYVRLGILVVEILWSIFALAWIIKNYSSCIQGFPRDALMGMIVCSWCIIGSVVITVWCTYDSAGRSWVKMQRYQNSLKDAKTKYRYKRSENSYRNWRHSEKYPSSICYYLERKAMRQCQDSWNRRCEILFCCLGKSDRRQNSFAEIAKLLSEFFHDLDIVPSDVVAGLILHRRLQKQACLTIVQGSNNQTYEYLSGVPITPKTKFLDTTSHAVVQDIKTLIHYLHYAIAIYGWPLFFMVNKAAGCIQLCPYLKCSTCIAQSSGKFRLLCCFHRDTIKSSTVSRVSYSSTTLSSTGPVRGGPALLDDNCCLCNFAAAQKICKNHNMEIVYASYHVEIGEPPFFVALDHDRRTVVVAIRGTLSLQDIITDLNAEGEFLPSNIPQDNWLGHKGMIGAAVYIHKKLIDERILEEAFALCPQKGTFCYSLVLVGHSLGAGTASILAIMLRETYSDLVCYAFSPPGGLLSLPAVDYTKEFITSVILGKDVVPRLGLHQMEALRFDLINAIKQSQDPKWKTISKVLCCCYSVGLGSPADKVDAKSQSGFSINQKELSTQPEDSYIARAVHQPLYPPGKIIHIVRNHPDRGRESTSGWRKVLNKSQPVYQAIWVENTEYDQILISPVMIQDHMPDKLLDALEKLLINTGPPKPVRQIVHDVEHIIRCSTPIPHSYLSGKSTPNYNSLDRTPSHRVLLETSFTDLKAEVGENDSRLIPQCLKDSYTHNKPSLYDALKKAHRLDLLRSDCYGLAPLASPELLSETSSVASSTSAYKIVPASPHLNLPVSTNLNECGKKLSSKRENQKSDTPIFVIDNFCSEPLESFAKPRSHRLNNLACDNASFLIDSQNLDFFNNSCSSFDSKRKLSKEVQDKNSSKNSSTNLITQSKTECTIPSLPYEKDSKNQFDNSMPAFSLSRNDYSTPERSQITAICSQDISNEEFKFNDVTIATRCLSSSITNSSQTSLTDFSAQKSNEGMSFTSDDELLSCDTRPSSCRLIPHPPLSFKGNLAYSPKSELLLKKLKSIDSSNDNICLCDAFKSV